MQARVESAAKARAEALAAVLAAIDPATHERLKHLLTNFEDKVVQVPIFIVMYFVSSLLVQ